MHKPEDLIGYNSAYISSNLLDELDYCIGGYGKPSIEFLFTLNTFVESFIGSSEFYTSLDELNHISLTSPALFPSGRPMLNLLVREGGLRFVNGVVDNPGQEIYRGMTLDRSKKEAQQDFIIEYGNKIEESYLIKSDIKITLDQVTLISQRFEEDYFIVSEVKSTSEELVNNLLKVARSSSIQTTLPIFLYSKQVFSLGKKPYSIQSLEKLAQIHETNVEDLVNTLNYRYLPIPPFTSILLSQCNSIYEIPQKLAQLRADFQELRDSFIQLEKNINEAGSMRTQQEAFNHFSEFWKAFNKKYTDKKHRILYGSLDLVAGANMDKGLDSYIDGNDFTESIKDLNAGKLAGNFVKKGYEWYRERKIINRFKGITNIWELFQDSKSISEQVRHFHRLFGVSYTNQELDHVNEYVRTRLTNIIESIKT